MRSGQFFDSFRRAFRRHRRIFAAAFAALAVVAALNALSPGSADDQPTVVAARPIAAGTKLTAADLQVVRLPADVVAEGAFGEAEPLLGETVVGPVPRRQVLTGSDLLGGQGQVRPGKVALPTRFQDAGATSLLRAGGRIDVLGAAGDGVGYQVVAADVVVLAVLGDADSGLMGGQQSGLSLLEVGTDQAAAIAAAAAVSGLSFTLR